jgi:hypothetical protein
MTTPTSSQNKPRLHITWLDSNGDVAQVVGNFADGPRGRVDAAQTVKDEEDQATFLRDHTLRENQSLRDFVADEDPNNRFDKLLIERVFPDGRQELERIPSHMDAYPENLMVAQDMEKQRVAAIWRGEWSDQMTSLISEPMTPTEQAAKNQSPLTRLASWEPSSDRDQALVHALSIGADPWKADYQGKTALHHADEAGAQILLEAIPADRRAQYCNTTDKHGRTALFDAAEHGQRNKAELLLSHGADSTLVDRKGQIAAQLTEEPAVKSVLERDTLRRSVGVEGQEQVRVRRM